MGASINMSKLNEAAPENRLEILERVVIRNNLIVILVHSQHTNTDEYLIFKTWNRFLEQTEKVEDFTDKASMKVSKVISEIRDDFGRMSQKVSNWERLDTY